MKIRFIRSHPSGIAEGALKDVAASFASRMIAEGYAAEDTDKTPPPPPEVPEVQPDKATKKSKQTSRK